MRNAVVLCAGLLTLMLPSMAMAQAQAPAQGQGQSKAWMPAGGRIFVAINGLYQPGEETIEQTASYSVYDETANASATQTVKNGGGMFDFGGGLTYTITPNVAGAFLLRFSRANADFEFEGATTSMNVGNVQVGAGVRLRF